MSHWPRDDSRMVGHSGVICPLAFQLTRGGVATLILPRYGLRGHRGVNAALFASQSYVRRQRTERRTGMRLRSLGDADIGGLIWPIQSLFRQTARRPCGLLSWRGLLNHFRRQVLKIAI